MRVKGSDSATNKSLRLDRFTLFAVLFLTVVCAWAAGRIADADSGGFVAEAIPFRQAITLWGWGSSPPTANPHFFSYPSASIYCCWLAQAAGCVCGVLSGRYTVPADAGVEYALDPTYLVHCGRLAMFGAVWLCAVSGFVWFASRNRPLALLVGASIVLSPPLIRAAFQFTPEVLLCPIVILMVFVAATRHIACSDRMRLALIGVLTGIALGIKLSSIPAVLLSIGFVAWDEASRGRRIRHAMIGLAIAVATFIFTTPFAVIDAAAFLRDLAFEWAHLETGHLLGTQGATAWGHAAQIYDALSPAIVGVALLAAILWRELPGRSRLVLGVASSFILPAAMSSSGSPERYIVPAIPLLLVFACDVIHLAMAARNRFVWVLGIACVLGIGALPLVTSSVLAQRSESSPAASATRWLATNAKPTDLVVFERGAMALSSVAGREELRNSRCLAAASARWRQRALESPAWMCIAMPFAASGDRATFVRWSDGRMVRVSGFAPAWSMIPAMYEVLAELDVPWLARSSIIAGRLGVLYPQLNWDAGAIEVSGEDGALRSWRDEGLLREGEVHITGAHVRRPDSRALDPMWWRHSLRLQLDAQSSGELGPTERAEIELVAQRQLFQEQFEPFLMDLAQVAFARRDWDGVVRLARLVITNDSTNILAIRLSLLATVERGSSPVPALETGTLLERGGGGSLDDWLTRVLSNWGVPGALARAEVERFLGWQASRSAASPASTPVRNARPQ